MADKLPSEAVELVGRTSEIEHEKSKSPGGIKDFFLQDPPFELEESKNTPDR